jgi:hypothetical protein
MAATTRADMRAFLEPPRLHRRKRLLVGLAAATALAAAGGLSRSWSRARGGDFRTALSFAGLVDKLSQLPGERRSAIYGFLFVPLALKPFFYIVN